MSFLRTAAITTAACLLGLISACQSLAPQPSAPAPDKTGAKPPIGASTAPAGGRCNPEHAPWAAGQLASARIVEQARVRSNARWVRLIHPGEKADTSFDAQRLSLRVNAQGKVESGRCE